MGAFYLTAVRILEHQGWSKSALKVLKPGCVYPLVNDGGMPEDFFGHNIMVSAIVGKNGSGKSSLLDMVYRIINNFAHCMVDCMTLTDDDMKIWKRAHHLDFCFGIYADLDFVSDGMPCSIKVRDRAVALVCGERKYRFVSVPSESHEFSYIYGLFTDDQTGDDFDEGYELIELGDFGLIKGLASKLFYSVVTSYAMQSFVTSDYSGEPTLWWTGPENGKLNELRPDYAYSWIDALFHKNDGYTTPIVLNPLRDNGMVDMRKEQYLTLSRVASLLLYYKHLPERPRLMEEYMLNDIHFTLHPGLVIDKCGQEILNDMSVPPEKYKGTLLQWLKITGHFYEYINAEDTLANLIITQYGLYPLKDDDETHKDLLYNPVFITQLYLVYKTIAICTRRYPGYEDFDEISVDMIVKRKDEDGAERIFDLTRRLIEKIKSDNTHITLKIRQSLRALNALRTSADRDMLTADFDYETYCAASGFMPTKIESIRDVLETMPPAHFVPVITLEKDSGEKIEFSGLSAGQRQFVYLVTTLVYHSLNILTVEGDDRLWYSNLCFILDEVEICFHPEYQRMFVKCLIDTIKRLGLNRDAAIHIIIATHSPFILSDIPAQNVLKLDDGKPLEQKETFGANIHDLLDSSFFLKHSIGDVAKDKIQRFFGSFEEFKRRDEYDDQWRLSDDELRDYRYLAAHVGDDYLRARIVQALVAMSERVSERAKLEAELAAIKSREAEIEAKLADINEED